MNAALLRTLAELEMLQLYHDPRDDEEHDTIKESVVRHCRTIVDLEGKGRFPMFATKRQFDRYVNW